MDSLSVVRRRLVYWMYLRGPQLLAVSKEQMAQMSRTTPPLIEPILVQYVHSKIFEVVPAMEGKGGSSTELYRLTKPVYDMIESSGLFVGPQVKVFEGKEN